MTPPAQRWGRGSTTACSTAPPLRRRLRRLHRHKRLWREPDAFIPERFLPENRGTIDRFAYLPFGAGPRVCIGSSFSLQEATIVLAHAVRAARLDLVPGHAVRPVVKVTLRPAGGLPMRLSLRG